MAIILPPGLPAAAALRREGLLAEPSGGEPLRVLLVNLMPDKPRAEAQFAAALGAGERLVSLTLTAPQGHVWHHTGAGHLARFYTPWPTVCRQRFDALIVTGAPVETIDFEAVDYWPEICDILDWSARLRLRSLFICWAAQAALRHRFGVPKHPLPVKRFGVYGHRLHGDSRLLDGLGGEMPMPVSRHTEVRIADLPAGAGLRVAAISHEAGLGMVEDPGNRATYLFNHPEYDATALADEYARDVAAGKPIRRPEHYYGDGDPDRVPPPAWREKARRFYANWLGLVASDRQGARPPARLRPAAGTRYAGLDGCRR